MSVDLCMETSLDGFNTNYCLVSSWIDVCF